MKKKECLILLMIAVLLFECPALSEQSSYSGFSPLEVSRGLRFAVYSAPSASSWRGADGKAMCNSNGRVFAAGREGNWVMIAYRLNSGGVRVGYVQISELKGLRGTIQPFEFYYLNATLSSSAYLTDDPFELETPITFLKAGTQLTYLMAYRNYSYVETTYQGQTVRGFIPSSGNVVVHVPPGRYSEDFCRKNFDSYDFVN